MDFSSSFSNDLFDVKPKRELIRKHDPSTYKARRVYDGWFGDQGGFEAQYKTKLGPSEVLSTIERLYLLKNFEDAISLVDKWLEANAKRKKPIQQIAIYDVGARCALRLKDPQRALKYLRMAPTENDIGILFLTARVLGMCQETNEALRHFKKYLDIRTSDYLAWKEIGNMFFNLTPHYETIEDGGKSASMCRKRAFQCMQKSLKRVSLSPRIATELSECHAKKEIVEMEKIISLCAVFDEVEKEESLGIDTDLLEWLLSELEWKKDVEVVEEEVESSMADL
ncbi:hypothetical protein HDU97_001801 [Phlyctochytrium planicorne]|nr:hypothetical protein HDU97_001801 [Phlyctochytrium planicorne]